MKRTTLLALTILAIAGTLLGAGFAAYQSQINRDIAYAQVADPETPSDSDVTTVIPANETPVAPEAQNEELVDAPVEGAPANPVTPNPPSTPTVPEIPVVVADPILETETTSTTTVPTVTNETKGGQQISDVLSDTERSGGAETAAVVFALLASLGLYMYYRYQHINKREMAVEGVKPKTVKRKSK